MRRKIQKQSVLYFRLSSIDIRNVFPQLVALLGELSHLTAARLVAQKFLGLKLCHRLFLGSRFQAQRSGSEMKKRLLMALSRKFTIKTLDEFRA